MNALRRTAATVYNMDLMPTILYLASLEPPVNLDAVSITPIIKGEREAVRSDDEPIFMEFHGHQAPYSQRLVRARSTKYVFNAPDTDELYNLETDPGELNNSVADSSAAESLRQMREVMLTELERLGDPLLRFFRAHRLER